MPFTITSRSQENMGSLKAEVVEFANSGGSTGGTIKTSLTSIRAIQATLKDTAVGQIAATVGSNPNEVDVKTAADKPGYIVALGV